MHRRMALGALLAGWAAVLAVVVSTVFGAGRSSAADPGGRAEQARGERRGDIDRVGGRHHPRLALRPPARGRAKPVPGRPKERGERGPRDRESGGHPVGRGVLEVRDRRGQLLQLPGPTPERRGTRMGRLRRDEHREQPRLRLRRGWPAADCRRLERQRLGSHGHARADHCRPPARNSHRDGWLRPVPMGERRARPGRRRRARAPRGDPSRARGGPRTPRWRGHGAATHTRGRRDRDGRGPR